MNQKNEGYGPKLAIKERENMMAYLGRPGYLIFRQSQWISCNRCNPDMLRSKPWAWELQLSHKRETWWGLQLLPHLEIIISQQLGVFIFGYFWWIEDDEENDEIWWNIDITACLKCHRSWITCCIWEFHLGDKELKSEHQTLQLCKICQMHNHADRLFKVWQYWRFRWRACGSAGVAVEHIQLCRPVLFAH